MKRIIIIAVLAVFGLSAAFAQNEFDAARFAKNDILGTARYMGMAGAFNSLGGDPTVMTTNPAGIGLYRSSELTFTANLAVNATKADYDFDSETERLTRLNVNNFAYVVSLPYSTGTQRHSSGSFGISFNRKANFHRNFTTGKTNMPVNQTVATLISDMSQGIPLADFNASDVWTNGDYGIGWLLALGYHSGLLYPLSDDPENADYATGLFDNDDIADSEMIYSERGYINEWAFTYSHNFDNKFYLGVTLGIEDMEYERDSYYTERYFEKGNTNPFGTFYLDNYQLTTGTGFNFKIGGLLRATDNLRLALAFHTPTWYTMTMQHYGVAEANFNIEFDRDPESTFDGPGKFAEPLDSRGNPISQTKPFNYRSPYRILAGASYIIGTRAIVSLDYEMTDYNSVRLHERGGREGWFAEANHYASENLKFSHTFKFGAEYRLTNHISLRAGLANVSRTTEDSAVSVLFLNDVRTDPEYFVDRGTQYCSLGLGYRTGSFFFDMAYLLRSNKTDFYNSEYDWVAQNIRTNTHNIVATVGFRF